MRTPPREEGALVCIVDLWSGAAFCLGLEQECGNLDPEHLREFHQRQKSRVVGAVDGPNPGFNGLQVLWVDTGFLGKLTLR